MSVPDHGTSHNKSLFPSLHKLPQGSSGNPSRLLSPTLVMCRFVAKLIPLPTSSLRQTNSLTSNVSRPRKWVETTRFLFMCWLLPGHGCYTLGGWAILCHCDDALETQAAIWGPGGGWWIWAGGLELEHRCDGWVWKLRRWQAAVDGSTSPSNHLHTARRDPCIYRGAVSGKPSESPGDPCCPDSDTWYPVWAMWHPAACRWYPGAHKRGTPGYPVPKLVVSNCVDHTQYIACFKISFMSKQVSFVEICS